MQLSKYRFRKPLPMERMPFLIAGMFLALAACTGGLISTKTNNLTPAEASPLRTVHPDEYAQIVLIRQAGLTNDHSQVPLMMSVLSDPSYPHPSVIRTALHSLAQLGATEALPAFDMMAQNKSVDPNYLEAMRQRLLAESQAASAPAGPKRAAAKLAAFYRGLSFTPSQVGAATSSAAIQVVGTKPPTEVLTVREVADMAYRGNYADYASLDGFTQISNTSDMPSALKLQLVPLGRTQRIQSLIDGLAQSKTLSIKQDYEMQLADDEGTFASQIAALKLQDMDKHREQYSRQGFEAIFRVLAGAGDATQAPLVEHYTHDVDPYIAYLAKNSYSSVQAGQHAMLVPDY